MSQQGVGRSSPRLSWRRRRVATGLVGLLVIWSLVPAPPALARSGTTCTVGRGGGIGACAEPDRATIQEAVDVAHAGDRIEVCPGTYAEHVRFRHGDGGVVLRGNDAMIAPPGTLVGHPAPRGLVSLVGVSDVRIVDFRLGPCGDLLESGFANVVHIERARRIEVIDNDIDAGGCDGVNVLNTPGVRISRNRIWAYGTGIGLWGPRAGGVVYWNLLPCRPYQEPERRCGGGIHLENDARARILRNVIDAGPGRGPRPFAIFSGIEASGNRLLLRNNSVSDTRQGMMVSGDDLIIRRNRLTRNRAFGLWVDWSRGGVIVDNVIEDNQRFGLALGAWGDTVSAFTVRDNRVVGNGRVDCIDWTTGDGSMGTANRWVGNVGETSRPQGLCRRP